MVLKAIQIENHESNGYILTFDVNEFHEDIDGHNWSVLIKSYLKNEGIELEGLEHDPESDFYCAFASSIEPLQTIGSIIQKLALDKNLRHMTLVSSVSSKYHDEDDMSTEEWLNMLKEEGVDMDKPRKARFLFSTLQDENLAKKVEKELNSKGYKAEIDLFEGDFIVEAQTTMKPELSEINKIEEEFRSMALNYGAIYIANDI